MDDIYRMLLDNLLREQYKGISFNIDIYPNDKNLVKLLNNIYINKEYYNFTQKIINSRNIDDLELPNDINDKQTKLAEIAIRNMVEYIKINSNNKNYFLAGGLYSIFLEDAAEDNNYDICEYAIIKYECKIEQKKYVKINKIKTLMRK